MTWEALPLTDGEPGVYAQGTETGAFVRLDDLSSAVAFNNMDRGVFTLILNKRMPGYYSC